MDQEEISIGKQTSPRHRYRIVERGNVGTCEALRWAWISIEPFVIATTDTYEAATNFARRRNDYVYEVRK